MGQWEGGAISSDVRFIGREMNGKMEGEPYGMLRSGGRPLISSASGACVAIHIKNKKKIPPKNTTLPLNCLDHPPVSNITAPTAKEIRIISCRLTALS